MTLKPRLTCTTPYGVVSRLTARRYSHVVVARLHDGTIHAMAWCGSQKLAEKQLLYWRGHMQYRFPPQQIETWELEIFPVDQKGEE